MIWLRLLCGLALLICAVAVISAATGRFHPVLDAFGIWLVYGTVGATLGAAAFAAFRSWPAAALAVLLAAGGLVQLWPHFGTGTPGTDLRLLQHNLLYTNDAEGLADRLAEADVATFQEVEAAVPAVDALAPDWTVNICGNLGVGAPAIVTRLPVVERGCFNGGAWFRLETAAGEATFVSLHLRLPWPWPQPDQMDRIIDEIAALPRPVVIAGDFNQGAWSHALARIKTATGTEAMPGVDVTHVRRMGTIRMPIDHVLLPEGWTGAVAPGERFGSDHMALTASIALP